MFFATKNVIDLIRKELPELNVGFLVADLNEYRVEKQIPMTLQRDQLGEDDDEVVELVEDDAQTGADEQS